MQLPVGAPVRVCAGVDPIALLQAHHAEAGAPEPPGDGGPRGAGADHEHVRAIVRGHSRTGNSRRGPPPSTPLVIVLAEPGEKGPEIVGAAQARACPLLYRKCSDVISQGGTQL